MDARRAVQRLDFETRIVGEAVEPRAGAQVVRLLGGIAFERRLVFGNLLLHAAHARRHQFVGVAQHGLHLGELVGVVGCEYDLHERCV